MIAHPSPDLCAISKSQVNCGQMPIQTLYLDLLPPNAFSPSRRRPRTAEPSLISTPAEYFWRPPLKSSNQLGQYRPSRWSKGVVARLTARRWWLTSFISQSKMNEGESKGYPRTKRKPRSGYLWLAGGKSSSRQCILQEIIKGLCEKRPTCFPKLLSMIDAPKLSIVGHALAIKNLIRNPLKVNFRSRLTDGSVHVVGDEGYVRNIVCRSSELL